MSSHDGLTKSARQSTQRDTTHIYTDDTADHLRHDDHITQVRLDHRGLLIRRSLPLGLAELLN